MLTLLSVIFGFFSNFAPKLLDFWEKKSDANHELEILKQRTIAAKEGVEMEITKINAEGDVKSQQLAYTFDDGDSDSKFISALRSSVRPIITYTFLLMFLIIKAVVIHHGIYVQNLSVIQLIPFVWTENDWLIFMSIIGFYFGSRIVDKLNKNPLADGWPSFRADEVLTTNKDLSVKTPTVPATKLPSINNVGGKPRP